MGYSLIFENTRCNKCRMGLPETSGRLFFCGCHDFDYENVFRDIKEKDKLNQAWAQLWERLCKKA